MNLDADMSAAGRFEDLTAVWDRCHPHLRPLTSHLPLAAADCVLLPDGERGIAVLARVRFGEDEWSEAPQRIVFAPGRNRFFRQVDHGLGAGAARPVTAIDARLWFASPTILNLEPTTRCNFSCWYCIGRHMRQADIRFEDFVRALDHFPGLEVLGLVGEGEPILHKQFFAMADLAAARGIKVMTVSNGSTFSTSVVRQLCESGIVYVGVSIDATDPQQFAASRLDGNLPKVWQGIERLRKFRDDNGYRYPKIGLKGTLFMNTENELLAIARAAKAHGVEIFESFQALNPKESYVAIYPQEHLAELPLVDRLRKRIAEDSAEAQRLLEPVERFCAEEGIKMAMPAHGNALRRNCDEQWIYALLSGDIAPCCQVKEPISPRWNLFHRPLAAIMSDPEYENVRFNLWNGLFPSYCAGCWKTRA